MTEFKEGDIVKLKSGGPKMTISHITDNGDICCNWFAGSKAQTEYFKPTSLIKEEETDEQRTNS